MTTSADTPPATPGSPRNPEPPESPESPAFPAFPADAVAAVLAHMNNDHPDDNLVIVRAFGAPDAERAVMVDLDTIGATWQVWEAPEGASRQVVVDWPSGRIGSRSEIRREIVLLYDAASAD